MYNLDQLIELAKEFENADPIDWDNLPVDKDTVYKLLASSVIEIADNSEDREIVLLATAIKLVVENFVLSLRLESAK